MALLYIHLTLTITYNHNGISLLTPPVGGVSRELQAVVTTGLHAHAGALTALHAKSVATGRIAGMREFIQDADDRVAAQIAATCSNGGDWGPGEQQTCMTAAALVVAKVRACGGAVVPLSVLKGICALPAQHFNGTAMRDIVFAWHWIVATGASLQICAYRPVLGDFG